MSTSAREGLFSQFGQNSGFVEELFQLFLADPTLVDEPWRSYFSELNGSAPSAMGLPYAASAHTNGAAHLTTSEGRSATASAASMKFAQLVASYRHRGHLGARINPLSNGIAARPPAPELEPSYFSITEQELDSEVDVVLPNGTQYRARGREVLQQLREDYCGPIGFEFMHLTDPQMRFWMLERIEGRAGRYSDFSPTAKQRFLQKLLVAEVFESELHRKYVGAKRFSLQGGDALIPMLDHLFDHCTRSGVREVVIGMAHRGRLNVLANTLGKPLEQIFSEFEDLTESAVIGAGDVKYHMGYRSAYPTASGAQLALSLMPNPSHLEAVNPVVEGVARALQDAQYGRERHSVLPLLIHGDAAVIGQGVVYETYNMSRVPAYRTGGTVHIVINNQVGFTTDAFEGRSSIYCTDPAKAFEVPVLHVNGEDVEAACWAMELALDFRNTFGLDVVVDLYCYRKYGHNEGDDPTFTQPLMYQELRTHQPLYELYAPRAGVDGEQLAEMVREYRTAFEAAREQQRSTLLGEACPLMGRLRGPEPSTSVPQQRLSEIASLLTTYPSGFQPHPKLAQLLQKRVETLNDGRGIEWGFAEILAFGSLVQDGVPVRLSGQDCGRGTFSQRHVLLSNTTQMEKYNTLSPLTREGVGFEVFNSTLSEEAVLAFEFGYGATRHEALVLWEAQFGDFVNGAQIAIDQFLAASEAKWGQRSGVTLLLPHGYEGQGPEHSSARLERFLQLCADGNMSVCNPTRAAQHFHLMRRQGLREIKRPLVVMTPKSLLRLPAAASTLDEFTDGAFSPVLRDTFGKGPMKHLVLLSGKVFYDVQSALQKSEARGVTVLRIEELYPFPEQQIREALAGATPKRVFWVQEEPKNMGAWSFVAPRLQEMNLNPRYIGRPESASTATGSGRRHTAEQQQILQTLLDELAS